MSGTAYTLVFTSTDPFPATLTVGSSGTLGTGTYYLSGTNTAIGSFTETYGVTTNDSPSTLLLTLSANGTVNGASVNEAFLYVVDSSGAISLDSVQLDVNGMPFVFTAEPWEY